jgi:hypothetical protein
MFALSIEIGRDINFPKGYDPKKADAIRKVIQDERFKFVGGIVSYWEPDFWHPTEFRWKCGIFERIFHLASGPARYRPASRALSWPK